MEAFKAGILLLALLHEAQTENNAFCSVRLVPDPKGGMKFVRNGPGCTEDAKVVNDMFNKIQRGVLLNTDKTVSHNKPTPRPTSQKVSSSSNYLNIQTAETITYAGSSTAKGIVFIDKKTVSVTDDAQTSAAPYTARPRSNSTPVSRDATYWDDKQTTAYHWWEFLGVETTTIEVNSMDPTTPSDMTTKADWMNDIDKSGEDMTLSATSTTNLDLWLNATLHSSVELSGSGQVESCDEVWKLKDRSSHGVKEFSGFELEFSSGSSNLGNMSAEDFQSCEIIYCGICFWSVVRMGNLYAAQDICRRNQGNLANIYNEEHYNMTISNLSQKLGGNHGFIWTGMLFVGGVLTLSNGQKATYEKWMQGQPVYVDEGRKVIDLEVPADLTYPSGMWNWNPDENDNGFICEYP